MPGRDLFANEPVVTAPGVPAAPSVKKGRDLFPDAAAPAGFIGVKNPQAVQPASVTENIAGSPTLQNTAISMRDIARAIGGSQMGQELSNPMNALHAADDLARITADDVAFGFADPAIGALTGEDERAKTNAARERAGWAGTGMDVVAATELNPIGMLTKPLYSAAKGAWPTVGRMLGYGAEGAGQAALSAAGHGERNPAALLQHAIIGGGLGTAGSAAGEGLGALASYVKKIRGQQFRSADEMAAAAKAKARTEPDWVGGQPAKSAETNALMDQAVRARDIEEATKLSSKAGTQAGRREAFEPVATKAAQPGSGYSPDELAALRGITDPGRLRRVLSRLGDIVPSKSVPTMLGLGALSQVPVVGHGLASAIAGGLETAGRAGQAMTTKDIYDLGALVRDPSGKGLKTDPETVAKVRDALARLMIGGERAATQSPAFSASPAAPKGHDLFPGAQ